MEDEGLGTGDEVIQTSEESPSLEQGRSRPSSPVPRPSPPVPRRPRASAAERILRAAARAIVERGAAAVSMHDVAEEAGVSKGLIHYHFHDKETLLARLVEWMTRNLVAREEGAIAESQPRHAIDDLWR